MDDDRIAVLVRMRGDLLSQFQTYQLQSGIDNRAEAARQLIERGLYLHIQPAGHVNEVAFQIAVRQYSIALNQELARLQMSGAGHEQRLLQRALHNAAARIGVA